MSAFSKPPMAGVAVPKTNTTMLKSAPSIPNKPTITNGQNANPFANHTKAGLQSFGQQKPAQSQQKGFGFGPGSNKAANFGLNKSSDQQKPEVNPKKGINYGDDKYITDLKSLEQFYEDNRFTQILEQRYEDFNLKWEPPQIVYPKEELYAQLKYYDDLKNKERLNERQLVQIQQKVNNIIKQINYIDNYEFFLEHNHDIMSYNPYYEIDNYKDLAWYQRSDDIKTYNGFTNHIDISVPKEKWWMTQFNDEVPIDGDGAYVNVVSNVNYSNDLLSHPMFRTLNSYATCEDLSHDPILVNYPNTGQVESKTTQPQINQNNVGNKIGGFPSKNNENNQKPLSSGFTQGKQNGVAPTNFPQKNTINNLKPNGFNNK